MIAPLGGAYALPPDTQEPHMTRTVLVFACLGVALTMACRTAPILSPDAPLAPPPSANLAEIRKAVIAAGTELGWVIQPQGPGVALGTLQSPTRATPAR